MFSSVRSSGRPAKVVASVARKASKQGWMGSHLVLHVQPVCHVGSVGQRDVGRVRRRHHQRPYPFGTQRIHGQGQCQRRIDAPRQPQHHALKAILCHVVANGQHQGLPDFGQPVRYPCPGSGQLQFPTGRTPALDTQQILRQRLGPGHLLPGCIEHLAGAIEDEFVLPAHQVAVHHGHPRGTGRSPQPSDELRIPAGEIGGRICAQYQFSARRPGPYTGLGIEHLGPSHQRAAHPVDLEYGSGDHRFEIADIVAGTRGRKNSLAVPGHLLPGTEGAEHVVTVPVLEGRIADHPGQRRQAGRSLPDPVQRRIDLLLERLAAQRVTRGAPRQRQFGGEQHRGTLFGSTSGCVDDAVGVAAHVTHPLVQLGAGNVQAHRAYPESLRHVGQITWIFFRVRCRP